jgi:hypothetical protein
MEVAVVDTVWGAVLAAALVALAPPTLAAQRLTDPTMPLPPGVIRDRPLEAAAGAGEGADTRWIEAWYVGASMEQLLGWYLRRIHATQDATLDTAGVRPGEGTPVSYHLTFHAFDDQCMNPGQSASASSDSASCKRWRRGANKRRALNNSRVGLQPGQWVELATFTWFGRDEQGVLVRRRIELRDIGLSNDWQRDQLRSQITLEREVVRRAAQ